MWILQQLELIIDREKNKENAKRSRMRKKFLLESLKQRVMALQKENSMLSSLLREHLPEASEALLAHATTASCGAELECAEERVNLGAILQYRSAGMYEGQSSDGSESDEPPAKALASVETLSASIIRANWTAFVESSEKTYYPTRRLSFLRLAKLAGRTNVDLSDFCQGRCG